MSAMWDTGDIIGHQDTWAQNVGDVQSVSGVDGAVGGSVKSGRSSKEDVYHM